jgi:thioesterase domain-containing protein
MPSATLSPMTDGDHGSAPLDLDAFTEGVWAAIPIMRAMGLRLVDLAPGRAAAEIPLAPNRNHFQMMYAGSLFTVAEMLGGALSLVTFELGDLVPLVKDVQIRFRRPASSPVRASTSLAPEEAARVLREARETGKGEFILHAELVDESGELVATTVGTYQLRRL